MILTNLLDMLDMLDKMGNAAWFTDVGGTVDECNETACKVLGRVKDEVIGQSLAGDLVAESDKELSLIHI